MTRNLTVGSPTRVIGLFTLPLLIGNIFQQVYQFTDAAVVGRMIGVDALAAVGAAGSLVFLLLGFTFGASAGLAIPVARAFGSGDEARMRRHVAAGVLVSTGVAITITVAGCLGARPLLEAMQTPPELMADAATFLTLTLWGAGVTMAYNFLSAVIRALGDSRTPLVFLIISCLLNAALVVVFIGVFHLGVAGAALATVVAQLTSVLLCLALIARRIPQLRLRREDWLLRPGELGESARIGLTMGFQMSVIAIGTVVLQSAINGLGPDAVAAATTAFRVDQLAVAPLSSFGMAMTTFVAQNRGAQQWARIRTGVLHISIVTWVVAALLGMVIIAFGTPIVEVFVGDGEPAVVDLAHQYLVVNGLLYPILASVFLLRNVIQGLGSTGIPTLAGFMELVLRAMAGLVLVTHLGFLGVALAAPLAWVGALIPVAAAWFVHRRRLLALEAAARNGQLTELPALATA